MPTPSDDLRVAREFFREGHVVPEERFHRALDLWHALDPVDARWTGSADRECGWLFRGQFDARWSLLPSSWRATGDAATVIKAAKARYLREHGGSPPDAWSLQRFAEGLVLLDFVRVAERDGYILPPDTPRAGGGPASGHEVTTLAQHYRLPTGLLDFTRDPAVALFWATETESGLAADDLAVWALRRSGLSHVQIHSHARARNQNLLAQDGVTVEIGMADHFMRAIDRLPGLEECVGVPADALVKLVIPRAEVSELRRLLEVRGVTRSRLTPGYYGVVQTVLSRYLP